MPRKEYTSLPTNYPVCEHSRHKTAYSTLMEHAEYLRLINPTRVLQ